MRFTFSDILLTAGTIQEDIMGRNGNVFDFELSKGEENYQGHDYDNVIYQHSGGMYDD